MRKRKTKHYLTLTQAEAHLALRALLSFRNKVVTRRIDAVDVDKIIKRLTIKM